MRVRTLARHLLTLAARLDGNPVEDGRGSDLDGALGRLERAVGRAAERAEEAEAQAERMVAALAWVSEGVVMSDADGTIMYRNGQAAAYVGARHGEALAERTLVELLARARQGEACAQELDLWGPPRRTLSISALPVGDALPMGALALIEDLTDKRRLEAVRRDFVANIGHELKTPVGALGLLAETLDGEDDPEVVQRLAARMQFEAVRLGRIVADLLDLSRIEAEEDHSRDLVPMRAVVADAAERLVAVAEHHDVTIEIVRGGVDDGPHTRGDRDQLASAVHNLLDNGIKYSDRGSTVRVGVGADDQWVEVSVCDQGIGIPARDLERIFERFYRVDRARARDTGGTGLGLSIVRHIARNHGGDVTVASREGEGSTFTLRLPRAATDAPVSASTPPSAA